MSPAAPRDSQPDETPSGPGGAPAGVPMEIQTYLRDLRWLIRTSVIVRGAALVLIVLVALVLLSLGVDRLFRLSTAGRSVALLIYLGLLGWTAWKLLWRPLSRRLSAPLLADLLERHFPHLGDRLRSTVDFLRDPRFASSLSDDGDAASDDVAFLLKRKVVSQVAGELNSVDSSLVVDISRVGSALVGGVCAILTVTLLATLFSTTFGIWFRRQLLFAGEEWPYRTRLHAEGFDNLRRGVPRGDPLEIRVRADGEIPARVSIVIDYREDSALYNLSREGSSEALFVHAHAAVSEPFGFVLEGGDYRSPRHEVTILERPQVERLRVRIEPPAYTGLPARNAEGDLGELAVLRGSTLALEVTANKDLRRAWLETEGRRVDLSARGASGRVFGGPYEPAGGGSVTVHLDDVEGVPPDRLFRFSVHIVEDRLPLVRARVNGIGAMITPAARLPLEVNASDDHGLTSLVIEPTVIDADGKEASSLETLRQLDEPTPTHDEEFVWEVASLAIEPERRLNLRVGAVDNDPLPKGDGEDGFKTGYSATLSFLVVTAKRLGEEFTRRQEEQRRILERVLEAERDVRDQVYKLLDEAWRPEGPLAESVIQNMLALARQERQHGRQLGAVAEAVRQILLEMENNRIGEADELLHLAGNVIGPLDHLAAEVLPEAALSLGAIRKAPTAEERVREGLLLANRLEAKIEDLQKVIDGMIRLETFTEIVKRLRGIIKTQDEAVETTKKSYAKTVEALFEDDEITDDGTDDDADGEADTDTENAADGAKEEGKDREPRERRVSDF